MENNLSFSVIQNTPAFSKLKKEWESLLVNSDSNNIFLTWEWMHTWWAVYGKNYELALIEARKNDGQLIGIAPFKYFRNRLFTKSARLEFIGDGSDVKTEYLDIIAWKGHESSVKAGVANILNKNYDIDVVDLKGLLSNNGEYNRMEIDWPFQRILRHSKCPVFELPASWDKYLASKSRNFRKKAKEHYRICLRDLRLRVVRVETLEELPSWMKELRRLHHLRWQGRSVSFTSEAYNFFHTDISRIFLEKGWLRLFFLLEGDKPIAGLYCFAYRGVYYYYQAGRDPAYSKYHLGYVLMNLAIQEAIREGARSFDMLTGGEAYKYHWANREKNSLVLLAYRNNTAYFWHKMELLMDRLIPLSRRMGKYLSMSRNG